MTICSVVIIEYSLLWAFTITVGRGGICQNKERLESDYTDTVVEVSNLFRPSLMTTKPLMTAIASWLSWC